MINRLFARYWSSLGQFAKFSVVGASGVVVNLVVAYAAKKLAPLIWDSANEQNVWLAIPGTVYSIRWYMVFSLLAFLVANLSNYQLNRVWSFKSSLHAGWFAELVPFFVVGLLAQGIGMVMELALMHPDSPIGLPSSVFDDSSGLRTKWYWAHLIMIGVTLPVSFLLNKMWTFRAIRRVPDQSGQEDLEESADVS